MCKLNCIKRLWRKPTTCKRASWKYWIISATWNIIKLKRKYVSDLNQILYSGEAFYFCCNLAIVSPFRRLGWSYTSSGGVSWLWGYIGGEENLFCRIPWIIVTLMNLQWVQVLLQNFYLKLAWLLPKAANSMCAWLIESGVLLVAWAHLWPHVEAAEQK